MMFGRTKSASGGKGWKRRLALYLSLLLASWVLLMFVVIPWDTDGGLPQGGFELIEGQRAYATIVRRERPTLGTVIRGLNMVGAPFSQEQSDDGRRISSGNIRMYFDANGEFLRLDILKKP